jgi:hypothetical protein
VAVRYDARLHENEELIFRRKILLLDGRFNGVNPASVFEKAN